MTPAAARRVYAFGPFRLEVDERRLLRDGEAVSLTGKAFDTLLLLLEGAGTLQKQQALMDRLWPDVTVEQNNLQYNVSLVRRALAGAPGVEIETVRGQGYRLLGTVRLLGEPPAAASAPLERAEPDPVRPDISRSQRMHFCSARDGTRLAYARLGEGPPLVKAANWLNHLEIDWEGPVWPHWLELLSARHCLIRYDARGNGLSDWQPPAIAFEEFVDDLGTVFDAAGVARAPLLGISQGAAVAAAYAARHPERVSALILIGGCARGWRVKDSAALRERMEAIMVLMRQGWGSPNPGFRQIFTTAFFPGHVQAAQEWFNELQRQSTSPANAAAILSAIGDIDVRAELPRVQAPTLVLHSRTDAIVPLKDGIELASLIPGATFVTLESDNHVWLADEPAWPRFAQEFSAFLQRVGG